MAQKPYRPSLRSQPISIRLNKTLVAAIDEYATTEGITRSAAAVRMVEAGFDVLVGTELSEPTRTRERVLAPSMPNVRPNTSISRNIRSMANMST